MFILADKKNKGLLNETEILTLLQQLNVTAPARVVKQKFKVCALFSQSTFRHLAGKVKAKPQSSNPSVRQFQSPIVHAAEDPAIGYFSVFIISTPVVVPVKYLSSVV